ncbi:hypothetical protein D3C81_1287740 [compost metagenome]
MTSGYSYWFTKSQIIEFINVIHSADVVHLVHCNNNRFPAAIQQAGDLLVSSRNTCLPITHKYDNIGFLNCKLSLHTY